MNRDWKGIREADTNSSGRTAIGDAVSENDIAAHACRAAGEGGAQDQIGDGFESRKGESPAAGQRAGVLVRIVQDVEGPGAVRIDAVENGEIGFAMITAS